MGILVDEKYAQILTKQKEKLISELSQAVSIMETCSKDNQKMARRQSPMLGALKTAIDAATNTHLTDETKE